MLTKSGRDRQVVQGRDLYYANLLVFSHLRFLKDFIIHGTEFPCLVGDADRILKESLGEATQAGIWQPDWHHRLVRTAACW